MPQIELGGKTITYAVRISKRAKRIIVSCSQTKGLEIVYPVGTTSPAPEDLLKQSAGTSARPVLVEGTEIALAHYSAAEKYLLAIPRRCVRLRLAALWPILIGLATLGRLASNKAWLDPERPSKVSRSWVYRMLAFSAPSVHSNGVLRAWIARLREGVKTAL